MELVVARNVGATLIPFLYSVSNAVNVENLISLFYVLATVIKSSKIQN